MISTRQRTTITPQAQSAPHLTEARQVSTALNTLGNFQFRVRVSVNPNEPGLIWRLSSLGAPPPPPSDLGRGSRDRRENLHKGRVRYKLQDCLLDCSLLLSFILYK